jgi:tol-pal system protein YbgF
MRISWSWGAFLRGVALSASVLVGSGCVTTGEFRKLEERVIDGERKQSVRPEAREQLAELGEEVERLKEGQRRLEGELEVARKLAHEALVEAQKAREALAAQSAMGAGMVAASGGVVAGAGAEDLPEGMSEDLSADAAASAEVLAYQEALSAWRNDDHKVCIDRFRKFLQTYPASAYADDAAYWMADCHFKQGDYRVAVLRFNDVVRVYPNGNKAPDALYRQGESLLQLGPGFYEAARSAFEKVLKDYPESDRAKQAKQQLEVIGKG